MSIKMITTLAGLALGVAGCTAVDTSTRNAPIAPVLVAPDQAPIERSYQLSDAVVQVSRELSVSEGAGFFPLADIVWRGDAIGDRHAQLETLFGEASARVATQLEGDVPVVAVITLHRFHGVTERTRYTTGGVYNMEFQLTLQHAQTGEVLETSRFIEANLPAPGGQAAVRLEQIGQTERVRVLDYLTFVLHRELTGGVAPGAPEPVESFL